MVSSKGKREKQKLRTRRALIQAASAMLGEGVTPTVTEAAERADVSRATAYRYFPSQDLLLSEAAVGPTVMTSEELFPEDAEGKAAEEQAEARAAKATLHYYGQACAKETEFRHFLRTAMRFELERKPGDDLPARQGRRIDAVAGALAPLEEQLTPDAMQRLCHALALLSGVESMVVLRDICGLDTGAGAKVIDWATRALVRQALADA
jgi:AcrR family transcriptional regulator